MSTIIIPFFALALYQVQANGPFAPAAGVSGSTAIAKDSSIIKAWATGIELQRGLINIADPTAIDNNSNYATFGTASNALGQAEGTSFNVVSLGDGGNATLTFNKILYNGPGWDFVVFENSFSDNYLELAFVEVSSDGQRFVRFPSVSITQTDTQVDGFGTLDPTNLNNLAGKYRQGFGTPFDLSDIADSTGIDLNNIRFIRIIDVVGTINPAYASFDSQGHIINDPYPTPFASGGFDLDAVGLINIKPETLIVVDFQDLNLAPNSYWNGSDQSGGFFSNNVFFRNDFNASWQSWSGWAYSNMTDNTTPGYANQYSAITAGGMGSTENNIKNYGLAYVPADWNSSNFALSFVEATFSQPMNVQGLYVTNSTWAYLSMRDGDAYCKKFGGVTGNDPDYFKLYIWGVRPDSSLTDSIEFYLADYRFSDNSQDYIVNDWRWVNLNTLGTVIGLRFSLESTDVGTYGMNTPAYFAIDHVTLIPANTTLVADSFSTTAKAYPNPFNNLVTIETENPTDLVIYDIFGRKIEHLKLTEKQNRISTEHLSAGVYFFTITDKTSRTFKLLKQ